MTDLNLDAAGLADISFLTDFPRLTHLSLYKNRVADLSPIRALIQKMEIKWGYDDTTGIFLGGNLLEIPPVEIVEQGTAVVRNYFKEIAEETVLLLQCKLLLVGSGAVGKTSLMKKLLDNNYRVEIGKEDTTRGIDIIPWEPPCAFPGGKTLPVKIHFWDFGGQDIMYTTHQFFLTRRSLYIFVWEAWLDIRDALKELKRDYISLDDYFQVCNEYGLDSVIEALNLPGLRRGVIESHFKKIFDYDSSGLENNYILVNAESDNFINLWRKYLEYLPTVDTKYKLTAGPFEEQTPFADIKRARTIHNRHDRETTVYHIFINMVI